MANFFIDRPIFAWVIALLIMLGGGLSIKLLPIAQYPTIAPPAIDINATYPGASPKTLENTVTQVIEQKMIGIDNLRYFASTSDSVGNVTVTLTFNPGTDPDVALMQIQSKLQLATPLLPPEVQQQGLRLVKSGRNYLMILAFVSTDGSMTRNDLADFIASNVQEPLSRAKGVGDTQLFGAQYAMRVWVNMDKLNSYNLTITDVENALKEQNSQSSAGQLGGTPAAVGQQINAPLLALTRLENPEQFGHILLRVNADGSQVRLHDVSRIELGGETYENVSFFNGQPAGGIAIKLATNANAIETAQAVRKKIEELSKFFPKGVKVEYAYDIAPFVKISIIEVFKTLGEAIVLVFLVMYLFLQNIRATIIPTIAVPVVLLGTFGVLAIFGYSINTLTMFGMVLAIGLLVDDAIVVVENVERIITEEGLSPRDATRKSMGQITGALLGIALVLSAIFVPMAFFPGATGAIYRQFSITIVSAMLLSVATAMILTPALCSTLLKSVEPNHKHTKHYFFQKFNYYFDLFNQKYQYILTRILGQKKRYLTIYAAILCVMGVLFWHIPSAFLPDEDQGIMYTQVILPAGASLERTMEVMKTVQDYYLTEEKNAVDSVYWVGGVNFSGRGQNTGLMFLKMKDWDERKAASLKVSAVTKRANVAFSKIKDAVVLPFIPPAVAELGNATGFEVQLQDNASLGHDALMDARGQFISLAAKDPALARVRPNGLDDIPQYQILIDQEKARVLSLSINEVNSILSTGWGASYINNFIDKGRVKKVYLQAESSFRMNPDDLKKWFIRNSLGKMVPFSSFVTGKWVFGPQKLERFNGISSIQILGEPAPGKSTGDAMKAIEKITDQLPAGMGHVWSGISYEERQAGSFAPALYALSLLVVFLSLAALYESWSIPFSVMLVVPLGVVGALFATSLRGLPNDIYFQVGLLTTIGLATKNAILIVEFAKELYGQGMNLTKAALEAAKIRLRPILKTSLAFTFGVLPLALSNGAGSGSQNSLGTCVLGGVIAATVLAIFFVPIFFVIIFSIFKVNQPAPAPKKRKNLSGKET